jgi:hypothetical protein
MMARLILTAVTIFLLACTAAADIEGGWTGRRQDDGQLHLTITREPPAGQMGMSFRFDELQGLTATQVAASTQTPVSFQYRTDAGTFGFEGVFKNGRGGGQMTFTPNRSYVEQVRALGYTFERGDDDRELFRLAATDVSLTYIREMKALYPNATLRELWKMRAVGVSSAFIRQLADAGYRNLSVRDLTRLAAAGVDARFIRDMQKYKQ